MIKEGRSTWKAKYITRLMQYFDEYSKVFVITADNVGSRQIQKLRVSLRGHAVIMMGKNTMMRRAIREQVCDNANLKRLLPFIYENVGFIFTKGDLRVVLNKILENKVAAPARAGAIAPVDVTIPAQVTDMLPEKTCFFQELRISTKITRSTIEIINDANLIKAGDKVGASEAFLLNRLNILPFTYGLIIRQIYDFGSRTSSIPIPIPPWILDIEPELLRAKFTQGVQQLAVFSLGINYPNQVSASHLLLGGFKKLLALAAETDIEFEQAKTLKEFMKDPSKFVAAAVPATTVPAVKKELIKIACAPEPDDDDMSGLDIFG